MTTQVAPGPAAGRTVAVIVGATLAFAAAQTAVVPSLDAMARTLGASAVDVTWTLSAHLIAAAIFTPLMGRLGDMFGERRLLAVALLCFTVGAVVSAAGPDLPSVVAGRIIQGVGGGIFPLGFAVLRDELPPRRVAGSIGLLAALSGLACRVAGCGSSL